MEAIERFVNVPGQSASLNLKGGVLISLPVSGIKSRARGDFRMFWVGQQHCRPILIPRYVFSLYSLSQEQRSPRSPSASLQSLPTSGLKNSPI